MSSAAASSLECQSISYQATTLQIIDRVSYDIEPEPIGKGGYGTVHLAKVKNEEGKTEETYALKFFGYVKNKPVHDDINREIMLMMRLKNVAGKHWRSYVSGM